MAKNLPVTEQRPWSSLRAPQPWHGTSQVQYLPSLLQHCGPQRRVATHCLRRPRPFNNGPNNAEPKPELTTPSAALIEAAPRLEPFYRLDEIAYLENLVSRLAETPSFTDKLSLIMAEPPVQQFLATPSGRTISSHFSNMNPRQAFSLLSLAAIGQDHVLRVLPLNGALAEGLDSLSMSLAHIEEFYDSIGGVAGYQLQCLRLIEEHRCGGSTSSVEDAGPPNDVEFLVPSGLDLSSTEDATAAAAATLHGLQGLPQMAEIYPLGGAGDRLGLQCEDTGDSLPTAVLPYCGRSLLEALIRDVQAREYLYFKTHGAQITTPIAVMTSAAKGNHWRVQDLFQQAHWFGRGRDAFRLFSQPLVPVIAAKDAKWLMCSPLQPVMKPGGHGVLWKLMLDAGIFDWLRRSGRAAALVRQISNPMAGQDTTLLALAGEGLRGRHAFGFASCERVVGAAEGMNVLRKQQLPGGASNPDGRQHGKGGDAVRYSYGITNVEYTEFERLGIEDKKTCEDSEHSCFPANTNVLFLGLPKIEAKVRESVAAGTTDAILPGMILNLKKESVHRNLETGQEMRSRAGRLECTMQNLADCFGTEVEEDRVIANGEHMHSVPLDTFMVYGPRRKVTSSAKRQRSPGSMKIHQTPDGSLYDLLRNAAQMMQEAGIEMPELGSVAEYLASGPGFLFFFHPALGPLWSVVGQKVRGGRIGPRSEVQLEIAEVDIVNVDVEGSLRVLADCALGHFEDPEATAAEEEGRKLVFSDRCGRVRLRNVRVRNAGIDWSYSGNVYWKHRVERKEECKIVLHGNSEFEAVDVELSGNLVFEVPDGFKMKVLNSSTNAGSVGGEGGAELMPKVELTSLGDGPSWRWEYQVTEVGVVQLKLVEL